MTAGASGRQEGLAAGRLQTQQEGRWQARMEFSFLPTVSAFLPIRSVGRPASVREAFLPTRSVGRHF